MGLPHGQFAWVCGCYVTRLIFEIGTRLLFKDKSSLLHHVPTLRPATRIKSTMRAPSYQ